jgi:hypothetical protein
MSIILAGIVFTYSIESRHEYFATTKLSLLTYESSAQTISFIITQHLPIPAGGISNGFYVFRNENTALLMSFVYELQGEKF